MAKFFFSCLTEQVDEEAYKIISDKFRASSFKESGYMARYKVEKGEILICKFILPYNNYMPYIGMALCTIAAYYNILWLAIIGIVFVATLGITTQNFAYFALLARVKRLNSPMQTRLISNRAALEMITDWTNRNNTMAQDPGS